METSRPHRQVVVVAGMKRSASTYLFNAVRVLYLHAGREVWGGGSSAFTNKTDGSEADVYVVKIHPWFEHLADYADDIVTSYRPLKEAWTSYRRLVAERDDEDDVPWQLTEEWRKWFLKWNDHPNHRYTMYWDDFGEEHGPWRALKDVAHVLGLGHLNLRKCMNHLRSDLAPPPSGQDPETLVFHNHYTSFEYEEEIKPRLRAPDPDEE